MTLGYYADETAVIGSSLGGFWATWLVEDYDLRAALINPAVRPSMLEPGYLGVELRNYHSGEACTLTHEDVANLESVRVDAITRPENIWLLAQKGDDTCDYRLAAKKYAACRQTIEGGGDHSFQNYERWIPEIIDFLEAV